ncbi:MAG: TonB-dependent receptor [Proteobacteria bacterium]|nr:TonB-dependent receptor [Pseudomonadota bacterium]
MLNKSILTASAFAVIASTNIARAQDAPTANNVVVADWTKRTDIVISATGVAEYPENIGQAVTVIDRQKIDQRQIVSIAELLATTPGVTMTRNGGLGNFTAVRIRGAEGEQTLTLIDGVRVNDPSSPSGGFDFANLLSGSVERVEVLRGPNSVPWGSQAIGGVVNVVTAAPTDGFQTRANAEYGSFDSVFANAGVSGKAGRFSGSLNAGYLRTDGISAAASGTERDGYRQYGGTLRVAVDITDAISLDLRGYYANSRADIDGFAFTAPFLPVDDAEFAKTQELYGYAGLNIRLGQFKNRVAFTIADINRDNFDPTAGAAPIFFARGRSERYEYQGDWQASDAIRLVAGAERENTRFNDGSVFVSRDTTSAYGEAILTPIDRLTLTGGVRYDDDSAYGGHTTFGANAVYALPTGTMMRASYTEGFKAPTLYQLFGRFGFGNPDLQPETARSYDAGIEQRLIGNALTVSATWFHRDTRNQIDFDPGAFIYGNIARTRAQGLEIGLNARPSDRLALSGAYSFINSINRSAGSNFGKQLARRPRQSVSASIDWTTPFKLTIGATVLAVGDSFDDAGNVNRLDGYVVAGVRAELPIGARLALYGRVDNLFDERYTVVRGYGTPGRAAYGGIRLKFD